MKKQAVLKENSARRNLDRTRKLVTLSMLSAIAFSVMMLIKIPAVSFLKYEPKDILLTLAGFLYGPMAALACTVITCLLELPFSSTGLLGMIMNILSSASFACIASLIYQKRKDIVGAVIGLLCGMVSMTVLMLFWNYLISPLYMGMTREQIIPLLTAMFLPFNLLKSGINAGATILIYRPFIRVLQMCGFSISDETVSKRFSTILITGTAVILLCVCIAVIWFLNRG